MHEVYPGIVIGKRDNLKHTELLKEFGISHIISFEDILSSASFDRLLLGKADFHGIFFQEKHSLLLSITRSRVRRNCMFALIIFALGCICPSL